MNLKKAFTILTSISTGILLLVVLLLVFERSTEDFPVGVFEPQRIIEKEYTVCYEEDGDIATSMPYLIVDLSDTTNFPHEDTSAIQVVGWRFQGDISGAHEWHAHLGVVTENDATNGTAEFFADKVLINLTGIFETSTYWEDRPLDTWIVDESMLYVTTNITSESTIWQNDVAISATVGVTQFVAAGDLVLYMIEVANGSTADFSLCVEYDTR